MQAAPVPRKRAMGRRRGHGRRRARMRLSWPAAARGTAAVPRGGAGRPVAVLRGEPRNAEVAGGGPARRGGATRTGRWWPARRGAMAVPEAEARGRVSRRSGEAKGRGEAATAQGRRCGSERRWRMASGSGTRKEMEVWLTVALLQQCLTD